MVPAIFSSSSSPLLGEVAQQGAVLERAAKAHLLIEPDAQLLGGPVGLARRGGVVHCGQDARGRLLRRHHPRPARRRVVGDRADPARLNRQIHSGSARSETRAWRSASSKPAPPRGRRVRCR